MAMESATATTATNETRHVAGVNGSDQSTGPPQVNSARSRRPGRGRRHHNHPYKRRKEKRMPSASEMPHVLAKLLKERKHVLLQRTVQIAGPKISWQVLQETLRVEKEGGMAVNALESGAPARFMVVDNESKELKPRRRTPGGVFFTLLRDKISREDYRKIYEEESKKKREVRNRIKYQRRQRTEKQLAQLGFETLAIDHEDVSFHQGSASDGAFASDCGSAQSEGKMPSRCHSSETIMEAMEVESSCIGSTAMDASSTGLPSAETGCSGAEISQT